METRRAGRLVAWVLFGAVVSGPAEAQGLYPAELTPTACLLSGSTTVAASRGILVDLDQDGDDDLVGISPWQAVVVCKSVGGALGPGTCHPLSQQPSRVAAADLDGDGDLDLVALCGGGAFALALFFNDGTGGFPNPPVTMAFAAYTQLGVGRLNGDAITDLILSAAGSPALLLIGTGGGSFAPLLTGPVISSSSLVTADDDGDGDDDLHEIIGTNFVTYRNGGAAAFTGPITRFTVASPNARGAFDDLDLDGSLDVLVVGGPAGGGAFVQVATETTPGTLAVGPIQPLGFTTSVDSFSLGDFDGDGDRDLLCSSSSGTSIVGGYCATNSGGAFSAATLVNKAAFGAFAVGDVTADGLDDALFFIAPLYGANVGYAALERGVLSSGLAHPTSVPVPAGGNSFRITDLDSDGKPDVVAGVGYPPAAFPANVGVVTLLDVNAAPAVSQTVLVGSQAVNDIATGDWNRDGSIDVLLACTGSELRMLLGTPTGVLQAPVVILAGAPCHSVVPADVNGDGNLDVVVNHGSTVSVRFGDGAGNLVSPVVTQICPNPAMTLCGLIPTMGVEDVDQDGFVDLVVVFAGNWQIVPNFSVYLGNWTGSFTHLSTAMVPGTWLSLVAVRDVNGDSSPDLVTTSWFTSVDVRLGMGGGAFGAPALFSFANPVGAVGGPAATGDLNGDGFPDLVVSGAVLINDSAGGFAQSGIPSVQTSWGTAIADLDGDLQRDLVFFANTGWLSLFHNTTPCSATGYAYGLGCVGSGGFVPSLSARGCASPGGSFTLSVRNALGGATAALFVGAGPNNVQLGFGCGLLIQLAGSLSVPFPMIGMPGPGRGHGDLVVNVPATIPPGLSVAVQVAIFDSGAPLLTSATNGLALTVQ